MFLINPYIYATDAWENLKSISMDGVDEYVDLGNITMLNNTGTCSVSMWVKCPHSAANATFFSKFNDANNRLDAYRQADEKVRFSVVTSSNYVAFESTTTLGDDVWTHLAFVWNGSLATANKVKIYENGSLMGSTITSAGTLTLTATGSASVGLGGLFFTNYYDGEQDEVSFFDYALTSGEVTALYNSGCPNNLMSLSAAKRPEHYYRFDDITYPTVDDLGETGGNDGTMTNMESGDIVTDTPC